MKSNILKYGGVVASVVLIAFGVGSIAIAVNGHSTVRSELEQQRIVGTDDMTPAAIRAEGARAGLRGVSYPTCSVAGQAIDTGAKARCFGQYMRIHTLEATGNQVYAQMGRYLDKNGKATDNAADAATDPRTRQPVANGLRDMWVTETALTTALNTSYFAENVALFSIVMGIALVITGIGLGILAFGLIPTHRREPVTTGATPITA
jgi:hypothetical protein